MKKNEIAYKAQLLWMTNLVMRKPTKKYEKMRKQWDKWFKWRREHNYWD